MKKTICVLLLCGVTAFGQGYMFVRDGSISSLKPRDLPSVGIRLDTGDLVLGLQGASKQVQEACGWYKVQPWMGLVGKDQVAGKPTYTFSGGKVVETKTVLNKITITPQVRINQALAAMPGDSDDERVTALVRAVAETITNKLSTAITITVPPASVGGFTPVEPGGVIGGKP